MKVQVDGDVREATSQEIDRIEADRAAQAKREADAAALKASTAAKLAALGLTEAEIAAIIGG